MTATPLAFSLRDMAGEVRSFPDGRPGLISFVKEDCATCNLTAPILEAFHRAWGDRADIWMVGQTADGNTILKDRHGLTLPILDDSALKTSLAFGFEIVPAVYWIGADGAAGPPLEGFVRQEWQALAQQIAADLEAPEAAVAWAEFPDWRPGCGSKHLDPDIHDRLLAEAEGSPIRARIGMNMKLAALGNGNRANATIGRALRLVVRNLGGARPGGVDRSTLSSPMKFTMCFAEWEEGSPWDPLHVERGFQREDSVVTAFAMTSGPVQIVDQESRQPDQIAGTLGLGLEGMFLSKIHRMPVDALLVVCPEHVRTLMSEGDYSKARLRERIQAVTSRPLREMVANAVSGAGIPLASAAKMTEAQLASPAPKFASDKFIHIVVAGSEAGKFSAAFHGWVTGAAGSAIVSRKIEC